MSLNFYDKVAKKFGGYAFGKGHVKRLAEYPTGDPEKIFKKKLFELASLVSLFLKTLIPKKIKSF